jgi:hypothetical protein
MYCRLLNFHKVKQDFNIFSALKPEWQWVYLLTNATRVTLNTPCQTHKTFSGIEQNSVAELYKDYLRAMVSTILLHWKEKCNMTILHHSPYLVQLLQLHKAQSSNSKFKNPPQKASQFAGYITLLIYRAH